MNNNFKVVSYVVRIQHKGRLGYVPGKTESGYDLQERRYRVISAETGEVLDDAQGYGYKTAKNAYAAYTYKLRRGHVNNG